MIGLVLALLGFGFYPNRSAVAQPPARKAQKSNIIVVHSIHNDLSPPLRDMPIIWSPEAKSELDGTNENLKIPHRLRGEAAPIIQKLVRNLLPSFLSDSILNFSGIPLTGSFCSCVPPDANGAVGATQYVQLVNNAFQVFDKNTGTSVFGPTAIASIWAGFGGVCQNNRSGDPILLYDHLANRWIITQPAGSPIPTADECIAISTTSDATGSFNRYDFHLGSNFFLNPRLSVWPDAYYASVNVFNSSGTVYLGPQAFAFNRTAMLAGAPATFISLGITGGPNEESFLPANLDGSTLPPAGAPNTFVEWPGGSNANNYKILHFHVDFATPANSTFTQFGPLVPAAPFNKICPGPPCVPQLGTTTTLAAHDDRLMFRLAYRNFGAHESMVGNYTVSSGGVAGIRWFELRNVTAGPVTKFQESIYQPDSTWRWLGSTAMDGSGNLAIGFSASSSSIHPQIRYAGRSVGDPLNTLSSEKTLYAGAGSQTDDASSWGDYSCLTIDPVDDSTFWYTNEYYDTPSSHNWRTRIGSFRLQPGVNLINGGSTIVSAGPNGVLDPGETVEVKLGVQNSGDPGFCTTAALTGTLQATGGVTNPMPVMQNYGTICPGDPVVLRNFVFTVDPALACGSTVTASLHMMDGATDYRTLTYAFNTGTPTVGFSENFDGVTPPALPAGWVATNAQGPAPLWVTSNVTPDTPPNDAFVEAPGVVSDKRLDTPGIIVSANAHLSFRNFYNFLESGLDGGVLEVSSPNINGGAFTDITDAAVGGSFVTGEYNATISTNLGNPIGGRLAWSGSSNGYIDTVANLGANVAGQTIKLRFRMGTANSGTNVTWRVDTISISTRACAPVAQSAFSRRLHGGAGTFDVALALAGNVGVECRDGPAHQMIINFANSVTVGSATVISGTGSVGSFSVSGSQVTVNLTGVANAQRITVRLGNVNDGTNIGDVDVSMGVLAGDVNGNAAVNASDVSLTKAQVGQAVGSSNFREDVNFNGSINAGDVALVKANVGTSLP